ncbi:MAG TPA: CHAT domain-containing protein [Gemmatimonadaceae bacterium]|nr:CHAT domain-containing protein [Gemmatimonadaceae bacterium]
MPDTHAPTPAPLLLEVVWGDITRVPGDLYVVGHYNGVEPQGAALALDRHVVSRMPEARRGSERLTLTRLSHFGQLAPDFGDIEFFPGIQRGDPDTSVTVALVGMGFPGTYTRARHRDLMVRMATKVMSLPDVALLNMVLIGSGEGTLRVWEALDGLLAAMVGFAPALEEGVPSRLSTLRLVERDLGKARAIHAELVARAAWYAPMLAAERVQVTVTPTIVVMADAASTQGQLSQANLFALLMAAATSDMGRDAACALLERVDTSHDAHPSVTIDQMREALKFATKTLASQFTEIETRRTDTLTPEQRAKSGLTVPSRPLARPLRPVDLLRVRVEGFDGAYGDTPVRLSYVRAPDGVRVAAITDMATVAQRVIPVDFALIHEQIEMIQRDDPEASEDQVMQAARLLRRILVPPDLRALLNGASQLVLDVDRDMAAVPWEVMQVDADDIMSPVADLEPAMVHLGLARPIARQLRTTLSPSSSIVSKGRGPLRALIIGDPGSPERGESLAGARREALAMAALFKSLKVDVHLLLGPPGHSDGHAPATRSSVIDLLSRRSAAYDILHYCGHGVFEPKDPAASGWLFADGVLGPNELRLALETGAPPLVLANACLSGRLAEPTPRPGKNMAETWTEHELVPSLADAMLQYGARNFIGTCREISDDGAVKFAEVFYRRVIPSRHSEAESVGSALLAARDALYLERKTFGSLWATYQHYGSPAWRMRPLMPPMDGESTQT